MYDRTVIEVRGRPAKEGFLIQTSLALLGSTCPVEGSTAVPRWNSNPEDTIVAHPTPSETPWLSDVSKVHPCKSKTVMSVGTDPKVAVTVIGTLAAL